MTLLFGFAPFILFALLSRLSADLALWLAFAAATVLVLARHRRRPVALIPATWLGKGQLLYLMFLWLMVIANFSKALVAFSDNRIATEGTIMFNALVCTVLLLVCARQPDEAPAFKPADFGLYTHQAAILGVLLLVATTALYTTGIRSLYGNQSTGWGGGNLRLGPNADWRVKPLLRTKPHA